MARASKGRRFGWYLGVAFGDCTSEFNDMESLVTIRGPCTHAPVWGQLKMLFQRDGNSGWNKTTCSP
jgi:hypothetical protein